jgi:hypothetical protein
MVIFKEDEMAKKSITVLLLLVLLLTGAIIGGIIGELLGNVFEVLNYGKSIGVAPFTLDLGIFTLTFGFTLSLNIAGIIGILLALFIYRRM